MRDRVKKAVQEGDLDELIAILKNESRFEKYLISQIDENDLNFLFERENADQFEFAGWGTNCTETNDNQYFYIPDIDDKYVARYKRIPPIGTYSACIDYINSRKEALKEYYVIGNLGFFKDNVDEKTISKRTDTYCGFNSGFLNHKNGL